MQANNDASRIFPEGSKKRPEMVRRERENGRGAPYIKVRNGEGLT